MGISEPRDLEALRASFTRWCARWRPAAGPAAVAPLAQPLTGLSSETVFVEIDWADGAAHTSAVLRLPPNGEGLFPAYDLAMQGRLQALVAEAGVPAVAPLAVEEDPAWLGAPFLLMPRVAGRVIRADQPYLRLGWLAEATPTEQATLHDALLGALAGIHRLDWAELGAGAVLGQETAPAGGRLGAQVDAWERYLAWAGGNGTGVPAVFDEGVAWCRAHLPRPEPPASLLWGDVQLGNVLVDPDMGVAAVLDFEMAAIGPAEVDLGWYLTLHGMAVDRCRGDLPGFPGRDATVAAYERRLGRAVADLRWFEAFAALRSGAILVRAARLLARLGIDDSWLTKANPTVDLLATLIGG